MKDQSFHLIKSDVNEDTSIKITTYRVDNSALEGGQKYVTVKNDKRIGWAMNEITALQMHDMYVRIHILHEGNSEPDYDAKIKEVRSGPQSNGFLHDIPKEELAAKRKLLPWYRNS